MSSTNGKPKEIFLTVYSGMCNRMFGIASALRVTTKYGHKLTVFWPERTGRYGLPYYGEINSDWDDYFERIEGVQTYGIQGSIKFQNKSIDVDQESTLPENLPYVDGKRFMDVEKVKFVFGPKYVDIKKDTIIIQKTTKPFGYEGDPMEKYLDYIKGIGTHKKDDYLTSMSTEAKKLVPIKWINDIINQEYEKFKQYETVWGIHIRGTDIGKTSDKDKKIAVMLIMKQAPTNVGFFVASDEPLDWVKKYAKNKLISYDNPVKLENSVEGSQHALVDLYLLAKCDKIFGTCGSSFSMMSWLLSDNDEYTLHS